MQVYLLDPQEINSASCNFIRSCYEEILTGASNDIHHKHSLTENIANADLVIAPIHNIGYGFFMEALRSSNIYARYKDKLYAYCPDDTVYPALPGIYPCTLPKWVDQGWTLGGHYLSSHIHKHRFMLDEIAASERKYLFSFVGSSRTHPVRQKLLMLNHPQAFLHDVNPPGEKAFWWQKDNRNSLMHNFREVVLNTQFALCPRGFAASSIRLFEVMEAGCVPVIIADQLALPKGPDWESFSIRIPENGLEQLVDVLEQYAPRFQTMSQLARKAWENYFSPQSSFHSLTTWAAELHTQMTNRRKLEKQFMLESFLQPELNKQRLKQLLKR